MQKKILKAEQKSFQTLIGGVFSSSEFSLFSTIKLKRAVECWARARA